MRRYSDFFTVQYDQQTPVGNLGRGTHFSICRWMDLSEQVPTSHDFAIVWDEDHDERIVWVVETLIARGNFRGVLAIGERKGSVTALVSASSKLDTRLLAEVTENVPSDVFSCEVESWDCPSGLIINASPERVKAYLHGIHALWSLGAKPAIFRSSPFR